MHQEGFLQMLYDVKKYKQRSNLSVWGPYYHPMRDTLQLAVTGISLTGLSQWQMQFDKYKMDSEHSMAERLKKKMSGMIYLNSIGNVLTHQQQIQVVMHALPKY